MDSTVLNTGEAGDIYHIVKNVPPLPLGHYYRFSPISKKSENNFQEFFSLKFLITHVAKIFVG